MHDYDSSFPKRTFCQIYDLQDEICSAFFIETYHEKRFRVHSIFQRNFLMNRICLPHL